MRTSDFLGWVRTAHPGERTSYHCGHLARDRKRMVDLGELGLLYEPVEGVDQLAHAAWKAMEVGKVALLQKRHDTVYEYIAVRL